jgi:hypothetical protein
MIYGQFDTKTIYYLITVDIGTLAHLGTPVGIITT